MPDVIEKKWWRHDDLAVSLNDNAALTLSIHVHDLITDFCINQIPFLQLIAVHYLA